MCALDIKAKLTTEKVTVGATENEGGTRSHSIIIGGQNCMPFLFKDGEIPYSPLTAYEFQDVPPTDWNPNLAEALENVWGDPVKWANYLVSECNASILFLRLMSAHPDYGGKTPGEVRKSFRRILNVVKIPLIVVGTGSRETDNLLMPAIAEEAAGEALLLGNASADNYREIAGACREFGHSLITESPIDINLAKQANILVEDMGIPANRIVMYATTGALGYGLEYAYSIMEKTRLLGLQGDKYMNKPQIAFVGQETWRAKESMSGREAGIMWETVTSISYLHAGADIVVVRHPETGKKVDSFLRSFTSSRQQPVQNLPDPGR